MDKKFNKEVGLRIYNARKSLNMPRVELGEKVGLHETTVKRYEDGEIKSLDIDRITLFAKALNTTPAYLMGWEDEQRKPQDDIFNKYDNIQPIELKKFPLLGEIACGQPIFCDEDRESYVVAGAEIPADFCLKAKGDSMINARILDGDIVFIKRQSIVDNGEIAAVIIDNEATLKRITYYKDKNILILKPENPKYNDLVYTGNELDKINILGKAIAFQSDVK